MMQYYLSYHELIRMDPPPVEIPGERVHMRESSLFGCWMFQHQMRLNGMIFALEGTGFYDFAIIAWQDFPELVERGDPGGL